MATVSRRLPLVNGLALRMTRLDSCGAVAFGEDARLSTDGFVQLAVTMNVDEGSEIAVTNAQGVKCLQKPAEPKIDDIVANVTFCDMDPAALSFLTGWPLVTDPATGEATGYIMDTSVRPGDVNVALEVWSEVVGVACVPGATEQYGYELMPWMQGGVLGDYTIENGAVTFVVNGMRSKKGSQWGLGPYNVITDDGGDPAPLADAITDSQPLYTNYTTIAPPDPSGGTIPLDDPDLADATGATAGSPGSFTPSGRNRPDDLAGMSGITASPGTAWTTSQSVVLEDGSHAYWDGTDWQAGVAP